MKNVGQKTGFVNKVFIKELNNRPMNCQKKEAGPYQANPS
jgi:hypothetical protein